MKTRSAVAALAALAQDYRLAIFRALVQAGPAGLPAGKIGEVAAIAPSLVTFHMKELVNSGMVKSRQEGRFVIYSANFRTMNGLVDFLTDNCCGGKPCTPVRKPACASAEQGPS